MGAFLSGKKSRVGPEDHSQTLSIEGIHHHENKRVMYVSGQMTSLEEGREQGGNVSSAFGGEEITMFYNSTRGFLLDCLESLLGKFGVTTSAVNKFTNLLKEKIQEVGGPGNGGEIMLVAWSQGGITAERALAKLSPEERRMINVQTMGSAALFQNNELKSVKHFIAPSDIVPLTDLLRYTKARFIGNSSIQFLTSTSKNPIQWGHSFQNQCYQAVLKQIGDSFAEKN